MYVLSQWPLCNIAFHFLAIFPWQHILSVRNSHWTKGDTRKGVNTVMIPSKSHHCFTLALSDTFNFLKLVNKKNAREWKVEGVNLRKMVAWRWMKAKLKQLFIGSTSQGVGRDNSGNSRNTGVSRRNLKADGKWMNQWKEAKLSAEQQCSQGQCGR